MSGIVFAAFSECHVHHSSFFLSPCYLIILQDSKKTCGPEALLGPVVYEIKMKGIMFILILPGRHCGLVEYTVNVVHG